MFNAEILKRYCCDMISVITNYAMQDQGTYLVDVCIWCQCEHISLHGYITCCMNMRYAFLI